MYKEDIVKNGIKILIRPNTITVDTNVYHVGHTLYAAVGDKVASKYYSKVTITKDEMIEDFYECLQDKDNPVWEGKPGYVRRRM